MGHAARYINRELIAVTFVVLLVLIAIALGGRFVSYLQEAALGKYSSGAVLWLLWLRLPEFLELLLPFALFLGLLLTFSRLFADQEMVVLFGGGVDPGMLVRWVTPFALVLGALVAWLSLWQTPASTAQFFDFVTQERTAQDFGAIKPGAFQKYSAGGTRVTYADAVSEDRKTLLGVFMGERGPLLDTVTVRADRATQYVEETSGDRYLLLEDGTRYEGSIGDGAYRSIRFGKLGQRIEREPQRARGDRVSAFGNAALHAETHPAAAAEWQRRIAMPIFTLLAAILAVGLSRVRPRQGRFARLLPGVGVFVSYYLALTLGQDLIRDARLPSMIGLWPVHLGYLLLGYWLLQRFAKPQVSH